MRAQAGSCLQKRHRTRQAHRRRRESLPGNGDQRRLRSEEHTSELQSRLHLVCRLLLEKKKNHTNRNWEFNITTIRNNLNIRDRNSIVQHLIPVFTIIFPMLYIKIITHYSTINSQPTTL